MSTPFKFSIIVRDVGGTVYDPHDGSGHCDYEPEYHLRASRNGSVWEHPRAFWSKLTAELALSNVVDAGLDPKKCPDLWTKL